MCRENHSPDLLIRLNIVDIVEREYIFVIREICRKVVNRVSVASRLPVV